jgi:hypothetical protein
MTATTQTSPLVVSYGMGVDSTAVLVGLQARGERPDLILFADTGSEKPQTYAYLDIINTWLISVGFPTVTVVKNPRPKAGDKSLGEACKRLSVLPSLAYKLGGKAAHQCSLVWKRDPQLKFIKTWAPARAAWEAGELVTFCIGYDAGPRDSCRSYSAEGKASPGTRNRFPLIEWNWNREECERQIRAAGLPVPVKSACFFCPASKKHEIVALRDNNPELFADALEMERLAIARGLRNMKGLGTSFSWSDFVQAPAPKAEPHPLDIPEFLRRAA